MRLCSPLAAIAERPDKPAFTMWEVLRLTMTKRLEVLVTRGQRVERLEAGELSRHSAPCRFFPVTCEKRHPWAEMSSEE